LRLKESIGIISQNFAKKQGIQLGDTIRITTWDNIQDYAVCSMKNIKVVGIYQNQWSTDTIYIPWITSYETKYYIDYEYPTNDEEKAKNEIWNPYITRRIKAATFILKNTQELVDFRDYIEEQGYSQVGKIGDIRYAIVIQDKNLVETVQNLNNHIRLIDSIKPVMMVLFGFIGFIVSYLLIKHRLTELVIMRSMGAKKRQVFLSFFLEQLILFFVGQIPVVVYAIIFPNQVALYGISLVFLIMSYLVGTAIALIIMNRTKLLGDAQAMLSA
jgi:ABC-type antimicrobial peptide transport system permease subunit